MLKVLSTGLQTTFQDLGRFGFRSLGVPLSGNMDQSLAKYANQLLGNPVDQVVIEFTVIGPTFEVVEDVVAVVAGIGFTLQRNNKVIHLNQKHFLKKGDVLKIGTSSKSVRGYIAVRGGFQVIKVLGSASFYPLICPQLGIEKGSIIRIKHISIKPTENTSFYFDFNRYEYSKIEVSKGPEFDLLSHKMQEQLFKSKFIINPQSNRMAIFLDSTFEFSAPEIITSPVQPGTVQLTPSGKLIVLMRDAQTTGGYARIFQLTNEAIDLLAQKVPGTSIGFKWF